MLILLLAGCLECNDIKGSLCEEDIAGLVDTQAQSGVVEAYCPMGDEVTIVIPEPDAVVDIYLCELSGSCHPYSYNTNRTDGAFRVICPQDYEALARAYWAI